MQIASFLLALAAGASFEEKPRLAEHSRLFTNWGFNHMSVISDGCWRVCFDSDAVAVKINNDQLVVQQSGMKMFVQNGSNWFELREDSNLPSHCELFAAPKDFTPIGTLDDLIEALNQQRKPFAVVHLYGGDKLSIRFEPFEERYRLQERTDLSTPSNFGNKLLSVLMLVVVIASAFTLIRQQ